MATQSENKLEEAAITECIDRGNAVLETQSVTLKLPYVDGGESFQATLDVQVCNNCGQAIPCRRRELSGDIQCAGLH